jgi:predicted kinase
MTSKNPVYTLASFVPAPGDINQWPAIEAAYPEWVSSMHATKQDRFYHSEGDVWTHTKMVVDALIAHSWWHELDAVGQRITWLTALLHDTGKPATTVHEDTGRISSRGHSQRGAQDARLWLWQEGLPMAEREAVCSLIGMHQMPFYIMTKDDYALRIKTWSRMVRMDWLGAIAMADARGRGTDPAEMWQNTIDAVELFRVGCEDMDVWGKATPAASAYTWQKFLNSPETIAPEYPIRRPDGSQVVLLSGLPGMGKNYWAGKHLPNLPMLSYDDMREAMGVGHGQKTGEVVHAVREKAKELLRQKKDFVWNATHISPTMRKKTLDLLWNYDANVTIVHLETSTPQHWRQQNSQRAASVPEKALDELMLRWEPPAYTEAEQVQYWVDGVECTHTVENFINISQSQEASLEYEHVRS